MPHSENAPTHFYYKKVAKSNKIWLKTTEIYTYI